MALVVFECHIIGIITDREMSFSVSEHSDAYYLSCVCVLSPSYKVAVSNF